MFGHFDLHSNKKMELILSYFSLSFPLFYSFFRSSILSAKNSFQVKFFTSLSLSFLTFTINVTFFSPPKSRPLTKRHASRRAQKTKPVRKQQLNSRGPQVLWSEKWPTWVWNSISCYQCNDFDAVFRFSSRCPNQSAVSGATKIDSSIWVVESFLVLFFFLHLSFSFLLGLKRYQNTSPLILSRRKESQLSLTCTHVPISEYQSHFSKKKGG